MKTFLASALLLLVTAATHGVLGDSDYENPKSPSEIKKLVMEKRRAPKIITYTARIRPISGASVRGVYGYVSVTTSADNTTVGYSGSIKGVQKGLMAAKCTAKNGCGVHIHNGFSCSNSTLQGGHYYVDPVDSDPWVDQRYSSDDKGNASFGNSITIGTNDINRRAFLVHAEDGSRIACGILRPIPTTRFDSEHENQVKMAQEKIQRAEQLFRRGLQLLRQGNNLLDKN